MGCKGVKEQAMKMSKGKKMTYDMGEKGKEEGDRKGERLNNKFTVDKVDVNG